MALIALAGSQMPLWAAESDVPESGRRPLRHILIAESVEAAQVLTAAPQGAFVQLSPGLAAFDAMELNKRLAPGLERPIDERLLAAIAQVVENFFRQNEFPTASAIVPSQSIAQGDVRFIVMLGTRAKNILATEWKIRNIKMEGARWFSETLLREKLRIEQGEIIRFSELDRAINWTNNNPFRRVRVHLEPVPNTGEADLIVAVQEALPLRAALSYSNSGNEAVGEHQYTASVSYANLWGRDHQGSYQYITTNEPDVFQGHAFEYRIPLNWQHFLQLSASYILAKPEFFSVFLQEGETFTTDLRYTVPLRTGDNPAEFYGVFNYKQGNNNIAYGGAQVFDTKTDVFQFSLGGSAVHRDRRGAWALGGSITFSPGGINSRNTDRAFDASRYGPGDSARFGARASYVYATLSLQRLLTLGHGWDLASRAIVQGSQSNLLPSEQMTIGGSSTVRGFQDGILSGDHGFVFTNEILAPAWRRALPIISKTRGPLETRALLFLDLAKVSAYEEFAADPKRVPLASAGIGVRMSLANNFSLSADYGWQLTYLPYPVEDRSRGHIKATLAF